MPQDRERRYKRLLVSRHVLPDLLRGGMQIMVVPDSAWLKVITCDLPPDLEVIHVDWSFSMEGISVVCYSKTFDVLEPGSADMPVLIATFRQDFLDADGLRDLLDKAREDCSDALPHGARIMDPFKL